MVSVPDTFYFTICAIAYRSLTIRSSFRVLSSSLRSICAHRSLSIHRALIVRSLGAQQPFIVRSTRTFNSSSLPLGTSKWKDHSRERENKNGHAFLITKKKRYLKQNECRYV